MDRNLFSNRQLTWYFCNPKIIIRFNNNGNKSIIRGSRFILLHRDQCFHLTALHIPNNYKLIAPQHFPYIGVCVVTHHNTLWLSFVFKLFKMDKLSCYWRTVCSTFIHSAPTCLANTWTTDPSVNSTKTWSSMREGVVVGLLAFPQINPEFTSG